MLNTLVSLGKLKQYISINEDNDTFDANLKELAGVATRALETYCRRSFSRAQYTEYFPTKSQSYISYDLGGLTNDGILEQSGAQRFPLKGFPISLEDDVLVNYDTKRVFGSDSLVAASDYYFNDTGNTLYLLRSTSDSPRGLKITYTAGYTVDQNGLITGAPDDLVLACVTQVMFFFNKVTENNIGVRGSKKHSPEYIQNAQMLCPEAQALAAPYIRRLVGKR